MQEPQYRASAAPAAVVNDSFHQAFGGARKDKRKLRRERKGWKT